MVCLGRRCCGSGRLILLGLPVPVRQNRVHGIVSDAYRVRCTSGVGPRPDSIFAVHRRPDSVNPGSRSLPVKELVPLITKGSFRKRRKKTEGAANPGLSGKQSLNQK